MRRIRVSVDRIAAVVIVLGLSQLVHAQTASSPTWTQLSPNQPKTTTGGPPVPAVRLLASSAYDPATNRMIVFGGADQDTGNLSTYNDVWIFTNADGTGGTSAWIPLTPSGTPPAHRFGAGAGYDPYDNMLIVFGGATYDYTGPCPPTVDPGYTNDVWILTNANGLGGTPTWTQLTVAGTPPPPRRSGVVTYDSSRNRLIVFGGNYACGRFNDVWVLSNANGLETWDTPTWTRLTPPDPLPTARGEIGTAGAYDIGDNMLLVFGGQGDTVDFNDLWILSNANGLGGPPVWTQQVPQAGPPMARHAHTVTYDANDNALMVIGGVDFADSHFLNDVWWLWNASGTASSPQNWLPITSSGGGPLPRAAQSVAYNHQTQRRATIFGGAICLPCVGVNDAWVLASIDDAVMDPPFATFTVNQAHINRAPGGNTALGSLQTNGRFTLAPGASIDPLTQAVAFGFGGFSTLIPAGSFTQSGDGAYQFQGTIDGVPLDVKITPGNPSGGYGFIVAAAGAPNLPPWNPVTVYLTIGHNSGSGQVKATFGN